MPSRAVRESDRLGKCRNHRSNMKAAGSATLQRLNWRRFQLGSYRSGEINGFCHIPRFGMGRMIKEGIQTETFRASIDD
jgi:hypothetical protein